MDSKQQQPHQQKTNTRISAWIGDVAKPKIVGDLTCKCGENVKLAESYIVGGPNKGQLTQYKFGCKCEDLELARETVSIYEKAKKKKAMEQFEIQSLLPKKLMAATFENYQPQNEQQQLAYDFLKKYGQDFNADTGTNVLLTGDNGVGKSHLCVATVKMILEKGYSAIFVDLPQLLTKIKSTFKESSPTSEEQVLSALKSVDILVLDDLGAESMTEWRKEIILQLINSRSGKSTIYTSNLNANDMAGHLGERNFSKWYEGTEVFKMTGKDMRFKHEYKKGKSPRSV